MAPSIFHNLRHAQAIKTAISAKMPLKLGNHRHFVIEARLQFEKIWRKVRVEFLEVTLISALSCPTSALPNPPVLRNYSGPGSLVTPR